MAEVSVARGRFAPSPTGLMHLGGAAAALVCLASTRASGGSLVLRIEDLDRADLGLVYPNESVMRVQVTP